MHEDKMKGASYEELCELKKRFIKIVEEQLNRGIELVNSKELGEAVDMVKDIAEAEKYCSEACYYTSIVKAMEEAKEEEQRYGYVRTKKTMMPNPVYPEMRDDEYYRTPEPWMNNMRMGYPRGGSQNNSGRMNQSRDSMGRYISNSNGRSEYDDDPMKSMGWDDRYGRAYNEFRKARRHYTETKSMSDKQEMDEHANEHLSDSMQTIREIWEMADPTLRKKMKADLQKFSNDLPV